MHECEWLKGDPGQCPKEARLHLDLKGADRAWYCAEHYDWYIEAIKWAKENHSDDCPCWKCEQHLCGVRS